MSEVITFSIRRRLTTTYHVDGGGLVMKACLLLILCLSILLAACFVTLAEENASISNHEIVRRPLYLEAIKTGFVQAVAFSPMGELLAATDGSKIEIWDIGSKQVIRTIEGDRGKINSLAFSNDGRFLASGEIIEDGLSVRPSPVKIWEAETGRLIQTLPGHKYGSIVGNFSPDNKMLATSAGKELYLWDIATGRRIQTLKEKRPTPAVQFSPDGKILATSTDNGIVRLWDMGTGTEIRSWKHGGLLRAIKFSPDGRILACGHGLDLVLWDVATGQMVRKLDQRGSSLVSMIHAIAFSRDGKRITVGAAHKMAAATPSPMAAKYVQIWNVETGESEMFLDQDGGVISVDLSPDGRYLACGISIYAGMTVQSLGLAIEATTWGQGKLNVWNIQ